MRWYQLGAWMPFFRAHAHIDTKRREPWTFSPPTLALLRQAVVARYSWLPYLYTAAWQAHSAGAPLVRPLAWSFPADAAARDEDAAFLFGDAVFVAPVVEEAARHVTYPPPRGSI